MKRIGTIAAFGAAMAGSIMLGPTRGEQEKEPQREASLMETLGEWAYPGTLATGKKSKGASISDGGNPRVQSVKCEAVLTTTDPIAKVIKYYSDKFEPAAKAGAAAEADPKSVLSRDDSEGRPVTVRVFMVNREETSTTLVISRAQGEEETHITWMHYRRYASVPRGK